MYIFLFEFFKNVSQLMRNILLHVDILISLIINLDSLWSWVARVATYSGGSSGVEDDLLAKAAMFQDHLKGLFLPHWGA